MCSKYAPKTFFKKKKHILRTSPWICSYLEHKQTIYLEHFQ